MRKAYMIFLLYGVCWGQSSIDINTAPHLSTYTQCSGVFRDGGGNYPDNLEKTVTICPAIPGQYVTATFTQFQTQAGADVLYCFSGGTGGNFIQAISGSPSTPFMIRSSAPNGCLTFRFMTNGSINNTGFLSNLSCSATPGPAAVPGSPQDCVGGLGMTICSNNTFSANSGGVGLQELSATNHGCLLTNERQSSWYYFSPVTPGTVAFTIDPFNNGDDYDFAIWGPHTSIVCPYVSGDNPIRCSYSAATGNTGLLNGAGDLSEPAYGAPSDKFVEDLNVVPGQVYVMIIDNWTTSGQPFNLIFTPGSAVLDCTPLPIVLESFNGKAQDLNNLLEWTTVSEVNNQYFIIEKSKDAIDWNMLDRIDGAGNSNQLLHYSLIDHTPYQTTYYRLVQVDFSGEKKTFNMISVKREGSGATKGNILSFYPNPITNRVFIQTYKEGENKMSILDQTGKVVFSTVINGIVNQAVEIINLHPGLYFISIENAGSVQNEKIIIKN
jgi:hypothetical protein